jgi:hypothetical protein
MKHGIAIALLAVAVGAPAIRAQSASTFPPPPVDGFATADAAPERLYGSAEYLLWWMNGASLPPLVTSSPPGTPIAQAGLLGTPGTVTLFGGSTVNDEVRSGMRFTIGGWVDSDSTLGVEGNFLLLEAKATRFAASSNGSPILARPFVDATTGKPDAERIAFPGDVSGSVDASATADGLIGAGLLLRKTLCCDCGFRLDALFGYRYLRFADRLGISEDLTSVNPNSPVFIVPGTQIRVADGFDAKNEFNGADFGLDARFGSGPCVVDVLAKLAVGADRETVDINGATGVLVPGAPPSTSAGGVLALPSNIGHHTRDEGRVIPELEVNFSYQFTPHVRASIGYSLLYWPEVVRGGDEVDLAVNPNLLPNSATPPTGPQRPAFSFQTNHLLAQGLNLGLEFRY